MHLSIHGLDVGEGGISDLEYVLYSKLPPED